jgi:hypothetical protein
LEVRVEDPLRLIVGVTDIVPGLMFFLTELARKRHGVAPSREMALLKFG